MSTLPSIMVPEKQSLQKSIEGFHKVLCFFSEVVKNLILSCGHKNLQATLKSHFGCRSLTLSQDRVSTSSVFTLTQSEFLEQTQRLHKINQSSVSQSCSARSAMLVLMGLTAPLDCKTRRGSSLEEEMVSLDTAPALPSL